MMFKSHVETIISTWAKTFTKSIRMHSGNEERKFPYTKCEGKIKQHKSNELTKWDGAMKIERQRSTLNEHEIHTTWNVKCGKTGCCGCSLHTLNHYVYGLVWFGSGFILYMCIHEIQTAAYILWCIIETFRFVRSLSICEAQTKRNERTVCVGNWFVSISTLYVFHGIVGAADDARAAATLPLFFSCTYAIIFIFFIGVPFISLPIADVIHHTINRSLSFAHWKQLFSWIWQVFGLVF